MGFDLGIGEIAAAAGAIGSVGSAIGAISSGNAQAAQAAYQAQVDKNNQIIASQNAAYATQAGEAKAYDQGLKERAQQGALAAALAANGIDINSGSAEDVRQTQRQTGLLETERVRQNAALTAYGYRTQSSNFGAQAGLDAAQSKFSSEAGWLKGVGGLLSSASVLPSKFDWMTGGSDAYHDYGGGGELGVPEAFG